MSETKDIQFTLIQTREKQQVLPIETQQVGNLGYGTYYWFTGSEQLVFKQRMRAMMHIIQIKVMTLIIYRIEQWRLHFPWSICFPTLRKTCIIRDWICRVHFL